MYTTVYSVVVDGDTIIEAVVAQYSINKYPPVAVLLRVIVAAVHYKPMSLYFPCGIGFTVTVPFLREGQ
jgi:hypothetical protein